MKKGDIKLLSICSTLIILMVINIIYPKINQYVYILFLIIAFFITIKLIGYEKDKSFFEKDMIIIAAIIPLFYTLITYLIGISPSIGFFKNPYSLEVANVFKNILTYGAVIILEELLRYNLVKKSSHSKPLLVLVAATFSLMNISFALRGFDLRVGYDLVIFTFLHFIPLIFRNVLLTYLSYKGGYKPCMIYLAVTTLPSYFMPIFPNLGLYIESINKIILPFLVYIIINRITKEEDQKTVPLTKAKKTSFIAIIIICLVIIGLNSGWFKYQILVVGTGSMEPNLNIGDVIVVKKIKDNQLDKIKEKDVLVFKKGNSIIVHRVVKINELGETVEYQTKGDANEDIDNFTPTQKDIIGITNFKIPVIGYPVLKLKELLK